jgi:hypothetical protein
MRWAAETLLTAAGILYLLWMAVKGKGFLPDAWRGPASSGILLVALLSVLAADFVRRRQRQRAGKLLLDLGWPAEEMFVRYGRAACSIVLLLFGVGGLVGAAVGMPFLSGENFWRLADTLLWSLLAASIYIVAIPTLVWRATHNWSLIQIRERGISHDTAIVPWEEITAYHWEAMDEDSWALVIETRSMGREEAIRLFIPNTGKQTVETMLAARVTGARGAGL